MPAKPHKPARFQRLDAARARVTRIGRRTVRSLFAHHAFDAAAAMTFYFFLGLVPLLAFVGFILGRIALASGIDGFIAPLLGVVPANVSGVVRDELARMGDATGVAPLSFLGFVYLTSSGTQNMMDLLEVAAGAPPRRWFLQRGLAIAWNFATVVVLAGVTWVTFAFTRAPVVVSLSEQIHGAVGRLAEISLGPAARIFALVLFLAFGVSVLALFFRIAVTHPPHVKRRVLPGAIVAVCLGTLVSWGFGLYVTTLGKYAVYYGSLAAVAVLLMWLYLTSLSILVGAEVNAQLEGLRPQTHPDLSSHH